MTPERKPGMLHLLPLVVTLVFAGFSLKKGGGSLSGDGLAFQNDPTRLLVLGGAYLLSLGLCLRDYRWSLRMLGQAGPYLLLLVFMAASMFWSRYPVKVFINWGHYAGFALVALAAVRYCRESPVSLLRAVGMGAGIAVTASIVVSLAYPGIGLHPWTGRWQGIAGNPNTLGLLCVLTVWAGIGLLLVDRSRLSRVGGLLLLFLASVGLYGARSTTSIAVTGWVLASLPAFLAMRHDNPVIRVMKASLILLALLAVGLVVYLVLPEATTVDGALALAGKDKTLTGRTEIWRIGLHLYESHPWRGWGFDSLASVLSRAHMTTGQFHNGYLDLAIRGGIIALLLTAGMILQFYVRAYRLTRSDWASACVSVVLVTGILIHNLTETSLVRTTHALWLMLLVLYFYMPARYHLLAARRPMLAHRRCTATQIAGTRKA